MPSCSRLPLRPVTRGWVCAFLGWLAVLGLGFQARAQAPATSPAGGITVAIGGALQDDNTAVWSRLVALAGGRGACFSIVTAASADPDASAAALSRILEKHGATAVHIRVGPRITGQDPAQEVDNPAWAEKVRGCKGIYMGGGAQARLLELLMPGGHSTPLLQAMREVWHQGGVVAGSSAGAAVLSAVVFRDAPDPLAVMKGRLRRGHEWDAGFAFAPAGLVIDQHAVRRGRIGRLLPLMQAQDVALGFAVEEDSAAIFQGQSVEVMGTHGVLVADLHGATRDARLAAFNLRGATLHWLESGDRFDLSNRQVTPSAPKAAGTRLQPLAPSHRGYFRGPLYFGDILGDGMVVKAMTRLVDGDQAELLGLAFAGRPAADDPDPGLAFEWRLWLDPSTTAWLQLRPVAYTVQGVRLDIVPGRLQLPLFTPLPPPAAAQPSPRQAP
jgi:cyanophycinase